MDEEAQTILTDDRAVLPGFLRFKGKFALLFFSATMMFMSFVFLFHGITKPARGRQEDLVVMGMFYLIFSVCLLTLERYTKVAQTMAALEVCLLSHFSAAGFTLVGVFFSIHGEDPGEAYALLIATIVVLSITASWGYKRRRTIRDGFILL